MENNFVKISSVFDEINLNMEKLKCINNVLSSRAISLRVNGMNGFSASRFVTVEIVMFGIWCIAFVRSSPPGVGVGFLNVHLGAKITANLISVAVIITVFRLIRCSIGVITRH